MFGEVFLDFVDEGGEVFDGKLPQVGEGFVVDFEGEGFGTEATSTAGSALSVAAIASEKNADVHFVGFGFHPIKEAFDAIPLVVLPE